MTPVRVQRSRLQTALCASSVDISDPHPQRRAAGLGPLKTAQEFVQVRQDLRGGMTLRVYRVKFAEKTLRAWTYEMPDGKLEQYQIAPED